MSSQTIVREVSDFLAQYPPFKQMSAENLDALSTKVAVKYYEQEELLFEEGQSPLPHFFVVKKGSIHIWQEEKGEKQLRDVCDEGDVFGIRAGIAQSPYIARAQAAEDSLVYAVPLEEFKQVLETNPQVALYIAAGFASGHSVFRPEDLTATKKAQSAFLVKELYQQNFLTTDTLEIPLPKFLITCKPSDSIQTAAKLMTIHNIGSIVVSDEQGRPLGIITDSDFRKKVVSKQETVKFDSVTQIMSSPVKTVRPRQSVAELTLAMVRFKITHLCVTEDGTPQSRLVGVVSQRDLVTAQGNNPSILVKEMMKVEDVFALSKCRDKAEYLVKSYLYQEVNIPFIANIISEINDVLIHKAVEFAQKQLEVQGLRAPQAAFAWLSLGSEGRKEQLLRTDQDNALIYEDSEEPEAQAYFLALGKAVTDIITAAGFEKCPADMMASNPQWCMPLSGWKKKFASWIDEPDPQALMHSTIFFDFRPVFGKSELADELKQFIFERIDKKSSFLNLLAKNALQNPPPLSFFRSFIVEKSGAHKNEFDIKARAMMPLADAARVLAYELRLPGYFGTGERFEEAAKRDANLASLCKAAAMAYEILVRQRALNGFKNNNSGRYINPDDFNKLERQTIRNIFKTIEKLQQTFETRYQLGFLR